MSKRTPFLLILCVCLVVAVGATACKKKPPVEAPPPAPAPVETPAPPPAPPKVEVKEPFKEAVPEAPRELTAAQITGKLKTVYFQFDKADLSDSARSTIRDNVKVLKDNPSAKVAIEGHCDERGTIEYNLALGERRARSVRDYMTSLGLSASRVRIVSFGEERPADPGHNESAWSKNRRGVFKAE